MYQAYSDSDYYPTKSEIVAGIPIDSHSFESIIHTSERKKLKRCIHHGLIFKQGLIEDYIEIYDLISTCREERGHHLSLSKSDLKNIIEQQTEAFSYYSVSNDGKMVAAAICIHISQEIYYVFYGGHLKAYDKLSPAVLLYKGIYDICQQRNIRRLDFGTSPDGEGTNHDLLDFKRYLGSDLSLKITFSKEL